MLTRDVKEKGIYVSLNVCSLTSNNDLPPKQRQVANIQKLGAETSRVSAGPEARRLNSVSICNQVCRQTFILLQRERVTEQKNNLPTSVCFSSPKLNCV